ncbi:MAG: hypothetical protein ACE5G9_13145 [Nitrospinales bacterium]
MMTKLKLGLGLCGLAALLYFIWPAIKWSMQMYLFTLVRDYGIYALLLLVGGGWVWWKLR